MQLTEPLKDIVRLHWLFIQNGHVHFEHPAAKQYIRNKGSCIILKHKGPHIILRDSFYCII
jgi:hypothetical protein